MHSHDEKISITTSTTSHAPSADVLLVESASRASGTMLESASFLLVSSTARPLGRFTCTIKKDYWWLLFVSAAPKIFLLQF